MIEAMACGTPVIAYPQRLGARGACSDGVTGFIVDDQQEAIAAARDIDAHRPPPLPRRCSSSASPPTRMADALPGASIAELVEARTPLSTRGSQARAHAERSRSATSGTSPPPRRAPRSGRRCSSTTRPSRCSTASATCRRSAPASEGLYHEDTRFLSHQELLIDGARPLFLGSTVKEDNSLLVVELMNPDLDRDGGERVGKGTLHIFRAKLLWRGACYEHIRVTNHGREPVERDAGAAASTPTSSTCSRCAA